MIERGPNSSLRAAHASLIILMGPPTPASRSAKYGTAAADSTQVQPQFSTRLVHTPPLPSHRTAATSPGDNRPPPSRSHQRAIPPTPHVNTQILYPLRTSLFGTQPLTPTPTASVSPWNLTDLVLAPSTAHHHTNLVHISHQFGLWTGGISMLGQAHLRWPMHQSSSPL